MSGAPGGAQIDRARHAEHAHDVAHQRDEVELVELERELVLFQPRERERVGREGRQPHRARRDHAEELARFAVEAVVFGEHVGEADDRRERALEIVREHRDQVVLDLVELDDGVAARRELVVELDVARGDGEILAQQTQREDVGGASGASRCTSRMYAVPPREPGMRTAARCSSSSSTHTSLRDASATKSSPGARVSATSRSLVAAKPPRGRGAYSVARPSTSSCTPESSASTSTLGSSEAKSVRAIDVIAVKPLVLHRELRAAQHLLGDVVLHQDVVRHAARARRAAGAPTPRCDSASRRRGTRCTRRAPAGPP